MSILRRSSLFAILLSLTLVIAACGDALNGDDEDEAADSDTEPTVEEPADSDTEGDDEDAETPETTTEEADTEDEDATPDDAATEEDEATPDEEVTEEATPDDAETDDATAESEDNGEASDDADAEEILESAAERAEELETAKFELNGTGVLQLEELGEVTLSEAEGAVERPDRAQVEISVDSEAAEIPLTIVSVDDQVYFTDVFTGEWREAPEEFQFNPAIIFSDEQGIPALIRTVENAEVLGTEEIDGRQAHQIYGQLDQEVIQQGTAGVFQPSDDVDFNVWVDQETSDVLQIRAEDPTEESDSVWEMRIFDHDEPVEIEDPAADES